ncbi:MAG: LysR family transcriptional regulator [Gammaproteobacteria bacterium]
MLDWDDLRFFLTVAKAGSVRAASNELKVSHSTVGRRIEQLEENIGTKLFDRTPDGYQITSAGENILSSAKKMDEEVNNIRRTIVGGDSKLEGPIVVTLPDIAAIHIYMDDFASFQKIYPKISLEIRTSYEVFDLSRREADVAIRMLSNQSSPPDYLIGRKLAAIHQAGFAHREYLKGRDPSNPDSGMNWLGWEDNTRLLDIIGRANYPTLPISGVYPNVLTQLSACQHQMGIALLPCLIGDADPNLVRVPPGTSLSTYDVWLLSHPDLRDTARIRVFREFISERTMEKSKVLAGALSN